MKSFTNSFQQSQKALRITTTAAYLCTLHVHHVLIFEEMTQLLQDIDNIYYETEYRREWCMSKGKPSTCFLFARKFTRPAVLRLLNMVCSIPKQLQCPFHRFYGYMFSWLYHYWFSLNYFRKCRVFLGWTKKENETLILGGMEY